MNPQEELDRMLANPNMPIGSSQYIEALQLLIKSENVGSALNVLRNRIKNDIDYRMAWKMNLINAFKGVWLQKQTEFMDEVTNVSADCFLRAICHVGDNNEKD